MVATVPFGFRASLALRCRIERARSLGGGGGGGGWVGGRNLRVDGSAEHRCQSRYQSTNSNGQNQRQNCHSQLADLLHHPQTPIFPVEPRNIRIINTPSDFYVHLKNGIAAAHNRVFLMSLYIGHDQENLIEALKSAMLRNKDLKIRLVIDYFRGTRSSNSDSRSSLTLLRPLVEEFPNQMSVFFFHTSILTGLLKKLIPPRWNEGAGLMHMKVYGFDDAVILSGANLNADYFTDRQDRYVQFKSPDLTNFMSRVLESVAEFSFSLSSEGLIPPKIDLTKDASTKGEWEREFACRITQEWEHAVSKYPLPSKAIQEEMALVLPTIQLGHIKVTTDEQVTTRILKAVSNERNSSGILCIASGYLNFPKSYTQLISGSALNVRVLTASPQANGFYNSKGASGYIPPGYTYLEQQFFKATKTLHDKIQVFEYIRPGWTFHAKGMWVLRSGKDGEEKSRQPLLFSIGSSNFGYRSCKRDLEMNAIVLLPDSRKSAQNAQLCRDVLENVDYLWKDAVTVNEEDLAKKDRRPPWWLKGIARLLRGYL